MKTKFIIALISLLPLAGIAQNKIEVGLQVTGGYFAPQYKGFYYSSQRLQNSFSSGIGAYAVFHVWKPFSLVSGLGYQYKQAKQLERLPDTEVPGDNGITIVYAGDEYWEKWSLNYFRIPLKLRVATRKGLFLESGIEMSWLLNYDGKVKEKPEWDWTIGIGSCKHQLNWSIEYVQGFNSQLLGEQYPEDESPNFFKNRTVQLNLSYPLWKSK